METEVTRVQSLMDSLDKQRHLLVNQMQNLKFGSPEGKYNISDCYIVSALYRHWTRLVITQII